MIGSELALEAAGWRRWLYKSFGTLDVDEWIWYWYYRKFLFPHLRSLGCGRVLDAGCGRGLWSFYIARKFPDLAVVGIDAREEFINFCRMVKCCESIGNVEFHVRSFDEINDVDVFDVILSMFSLHYSYRHDVDILKRFSLALKPGGFLLLTLPLAWSVRRQVADLPEVPPMHATKYGIDVNLKEFAEHYFPNELTEKLKISGFENITISRIVGRCGRFAKDLYASTSGSLPIKAAVWPPTFILGWLDSTIVANDGWYLLATARAVKS